MFICYLLKNIVIFFIGIKIFSLCFNLISTTEESYRNRTVVLETALNNTRTIDANFIDTNNNDTIVHITGNAITDSEVEDKLFGIKENAFKIRRTVEMYQWDENGVVSLLEPHRKHNNDHKVWYHKIIENGDYEMQNPNFPLESNISYNLNMELGNYTISEDIVKKSNDFDRYVLSEKQLNEMEYPNTIKLYKDLYYTSDPLNPQIGDIRIGFDIVPQGKNTVIGIQNNNIIEELILFDDTGVEFHNSFLEETLKGSELDNNFLDTLKRLPV